MFLRDIIAYFIGHEQEWVTPFHMAMRSAVVFVLGLIMARIHPRFMGIRNTFNFTLYVIVGSLLAAGITGNTPFRSTLITFLWLMALDYLFSALVFYFPRFNRFFKSSPVILVQCGTIEWGAMRRYFITKDDLMKALHTKANTADLSRVRRAYFEEGGDITFVLDH